MQLFNPCKKCIVKVMCMERCDKEIMYWRTKLTIRERVLDILFIIILAPVVYYFLKILYSLVR